MEKTTKDFEAWFRSSFGFNFPINTENLKAVAEQYKIDWLSFCCEAIVQSHCFSSASMVAKNYFDIKEPAVGDQMETLKVFRNHAKSFDTAAKIYVKKPFSEKALLYKKMILEDKILSTVTPSPEPSSEPIPVPSSGWNDKTQPDGSETKELELEEYKKYIVAAGKWLAIGSFVIGGISVFVPQLRSISTALKALNTIIKTIKKEVIQPTKKG